MDLDVAIPHAAFKRMLQYMPDAESSLVFAAKFPADWKMPTTLPPPPMQSPIVTGSSGTIDIPAGSVQPPDVNSCNGSMVYC